MKKIIYITTLLFVMLGFNACDKGFEKENTDPIRIINTSPDKLLAPALVNTLTANMVRNRNFNNELMQVTVAQSEDEFAVFRYDFRPNIADYTWNNWYSELTNFKDIYEVASQPQYQNNSYKGISLVCEAWVFSLLTDTYGDVPFKEANLGKTGLVEPAFDPQKDIYQALFAKLEEANNLLSENVAIDVASDPVYKGNITLWRKFCNSLHLRLLLRLSGKAEVASSMIAKIKEIAETNPTKYPIFNSNAESAVLKWTGLTVTTDPFTSPYVNALREADFTITSLCNFFMLKLNFWTDPRIDISAKYGANSRNRLGIAAGSGGFVGVESGYEIGNRENKQSYFYSSGASDFSLQKNPLTGIMMTYAEVEFILAEATAKGWIAGTAANHYYNGIANAINYWVPAFSTNISGQEFTDYIAAAGLSWNDALPLESATGDSKMERIHLQKYFSLFQTDFQQWFEYRRTGHPILPKGTGLRNGGRMPARLNYPVYVQAANPTNYSKAVANMGADNINTQVWWQKP
ncbi:MAG: SusD/RagB family nutrient-binding outer membrane lipoprotein [Pedobacter sp.]|uniref:SusD/RagB family nutrient-binding outer membrane lipoprotein n=1 Tax=Pedobacter sp. TaxID=1411316 RepID=UPI002809CACA|nr:SusD/RagB family nutrient-binding outer membrane lipoprotein [Pedobacter sp.]MDQ8004581.1 SusD/RagB family nutrient-binding outer membrane lipoprotein [Pedobacter sp.]